MWSAEPIGVSEQPVVISASDLEADWIRQAVVRPRSAGSGTILTSDDAAGGCDGVIDGTFGFHTGQDEKPWWQVDLGQVTPLSRVVIYNRDDGVAARAAHLCLLLSDDGNQWRQVYQHDGTEFFGFKDQKPLVISLPRQSARLVRVQLPGKEFLHLEEIEVYGARRRQPRSTPSGRSIECQPMVYLQIAERRHPGRTRFLRGRQGD